MELGNYYDLVIAETEKLSAKAAVEQTKTAEAIAMLDEKGEVFKTAEEAQVAVDAIIENDYAQKVAAVCSEFAIDEVEFTDEKEKVAAAMDIVDGWEKISVAGGKYVKSGIEGIKKFVTAHPTKSMLLATGGAAAAGTAVNAAVAPKGHRVAGVVGGFPAAVAMRSMSRDKK